MSTPAPLAAVVDETVRSRRSVVQALNAVMESVQAVRKLDRNQAQGFNFRGIDAVVNAVGPALRQHGVVIVPLAEDAHYESFTTKGRDGKPGTQMRSVTLRIRWGLYGPQGDHIEAVTYGEAADAGDKAVPKAHSVAYRTLLLQALCIPTDEPDPDAQSYERVVPDPPMQRVVPDPPMQRMDNNDPSVIRGRIANLGKGKEMSPEEIAADFRDWSRGEDIREADVATLAEYLAHLRGQS